MNKMDLYIFNNIYNLLYKLINKYFNMNQYYLILIKE